MRGRRRITFFPDETAVSVPAGHTILDAAREAGLPVNSLCGGKGTCRKCLVKILHPDARIISPADEQNPWVEEVQGELRLACQTPVENGMKVVILAEGLDIGVKSKTIDKTDITGFARRVKKEHLRLHPHSGPNPVSDWDQITAALPNLEKPSLAGLKTLSAMMRQTDFNATVVSLDNECLSVEHGNTEKKNYGLAVDVGTTTVAIYLADLHSGRILHSNADLNGQSPFGADVISRICYADEHPNGPAALQKAVVKTINKLLDKLFSKRLIDRDNIYLASVVGNPTMMHLFLGMNPHGLAEFPFNPVFSGPIKVSASEIGMNLPSHAQIEVLPLISAYVGADTIAASLAADLDQPGPPRLLLDIGTNGEVVLAVDGKIWACSTAAGPALEGGAIMFGMRAAPGAISAVNITSDVELLIIGHRSAKGLCGSGLLDTVARMLERGLIGKTGRIKDINSLPQDTPAAIRRRMIPNEKGQNFYLTPDVYLTQGDISQLQLAKGAMRAGIEILMAEAGIASSDVEEVMLAGAFGASLRPESLLTVGLLPHCPPEKINAIGNAAGMGALLCLLSNEHHERALRLARRINYLELSLRKDFQNRFMNGIKF